MRKTKINFMEAVLWKQTVMKKSIWVVDGSMQKTESGLKSRGDVA